jgi:DNA-directed RNA polymerase subunit M/transcription elongation factor TFIIS
MRVEPMKWALLVHQHPSASLSVSCEVMDEMMVANKEAHVMRTKAIANAIEKDLLADRPRSQHQSQLCFACGRSYINGDHDNPRFCSTRSREAFDNGFVPPYSEHQPIKYMQPRGDGFLIPCAQCRREFISKGLRCCSTECERKLRERKEIAATIAEAGIEQPTARAKCEKCGNNIPRWTGARTRKRATPRGTRFCGRKCREAA